jgi:zinc D-Ala-D-Ala carboxypeptidase
MNTIKNISKHISFSEATNSYTAKKENIDNTPNPTQLENMKLLAINIFEPIRNYFKVPIYIPSFFRSEKLNEKIKGALGSQHTKGEAIDLDADRYGKITNKQIFDYIKNNLNFDQLIWEYGSDINPSWVHVSCKAKNNRKEILQAIKENGKTKYIKYEEINS